jgi:serine O-acetyltransferase
LDRNQLKSLIRSDLHRYCGRTDWRIALYALFRTPGFRFTFFLRRTTYHYEHRSSFFHRIAFGINKLILDHYELKYGFQIPHLTRIGRGLCIYHHGNVLVHPKAVLGENVCLSPGSVIGQSNRGKHAGVPVVGNRVWIGCNAVVAGAISIGDDALIAPGAYVSFDVPEKAVVIGNPGQIKSYDGSERYVCNILRESGSVEEQRIPSQVNGRSDVVTNVGDSALIVGETGRVMEPRRSDVLAEASASRELIGLRPRKCEATWK